MRAVVQGDFARIDQFFGFGIAAVPAALVVKAPVVLAFFAEQAHLGLGQRNDLALRVGTDDFKRGGCAFARHIAVKLRAHGNQFVGGPDAALDGTHHRAAARFQQAGRHPHLHGRVRTCHAGIHADPGCALVVQRFLGQFTERATRVIGNITENKAGPFLRQGETVALDLEAGQQAVAGGGCAVEVIALHIDDQFLVRRQHLLFRRQRHLHAFRQEFLDLELPRRIRRARSGIHAQFKQPRTRLGIQRQVDGALNITDQIFLGLPQGGLHHAAIGALDRRRQRRGRQHAAVQVARQHRHIEGLARTVQIAASVDEQIIGARHMAARIELRQVQRRFAQGQHGHFLVARGADDARIGEAAVKTHMALRIGSGLGQRLARAVHQFEHGAGNGLARLQRHGIGFDAVVVTARMQADVADVEIRDLVFVAEPARLAHDRDIDAGLLQFLHAFNRQEGDVAAVRLVVGDETALIDAGRQRIQAVQIPVADRAFQAAVVGIAPVVLFVVAAFIFVGGRRGVAANAQHRFEQFRHTVRRHAQKLHVDLGHVHGRHRQTAVLAGRQHHAAAGEIERRRHGLRIHFAIRGFSQHDLVTHAGQTRTYRDGVFALRLDVREIHHARVLAHDPAAFQDLAFGRGIARLDRGRLVTRIGGGFVVFVGLARRGAQVGDLKEIIQLGLGVHRLGERDRERQCLVELARLAGQRRKGVGCAHRRAGAQCGLAVTRRCGSRGRTRGLRRGGNRRRLDRGRALLVLTAHPPAHADGARQHHNAGNRQPGLTNLSTHGKPLRLLEYNAPLRRSCRPAAPRASPHADTAVPCTAQRRLRGRRLYSWY
ncbi:hypothetical protein D3C72_591200 [compost metagenome]